MSDPRSDRPPGAVLYSEKLLGLWSECSACGEWERSTGWLLFRDGDPFRWYVDLKCTGCRSRGGTWKRDWVPLIEEVLGTERGPVMAAPSKPCPECGGDRKCNACSGTGVDIGVAILAGYEGDCEKCGGMGVCPACAGSGRVKSNKMRSSLAATSAQTTQRAVAAGEAERVRTQRFGCDHCWPDDAQAAWGARDGLRRVRELIDESHFIVTILACPRCAQRYVSVFTETIDWADGDDPQYWTVLPITAAEGEGLIQRADSLNETALNALGHERRSLRRHSPKNGPSRVYWGSGILVGPHD